MSCVTGYTFDAFGGGVSARCGEHILFRPPWQAWVEFMDAAEAWAEKLCTGDGSRVVNIGDVPAGAKVEIVRDAITGRIDSVVVNGEERPVIDAKAEAAKAERIAKQAALKATEADMPAIEAQESGVVSGFVPCFTSVAHFPLEWFDGVMYATLDQIADDDPGRNLLKTWPDNHRLGRF